MLIQKYDDAITAIKSLNPDEKALLANDAYLAGDHYQKMDAWGGPPLPAGIDGYEETKAALERDQAPVPVIEEIVEHYRTGLLGNDPAFQVELKRELKDDEQPSAQETQDIGLFNDALTAFFDDSGAAETLQEFVENLCSGRSTLRPYFSPALAKNGGWQGKDLNEIISKFGLESPKWSNAGVLHDKQSNENTGVYLYTDSEPLAVDKPPSERAEITYVRPDGKTVFKVLGQGKTTGAAQLDASGDEEKVYDCNGHIWIFQASLRRPIIGRTQRELQRKLDFLNYILPKNAQYAGMRSHHFIGVDQEVDEVTGEKVAPVLGPGRVAFWQPSTVNVDGVEKALPATLVLTEPVDSGPIRDDIDHMLQIMLRSRHLLHTVMSGDAMASAISRIQSRAQFTRALLMLKAKVEKVLRDLFMTVLCLACEFSGETTLLARLKKDYRIRVDIKPDAGPLTPDEIRIIIDMWKAGFLDLETAQTMVGLEDIGSVANRLEAEASSNLDMQIKRAQLFNEYSQAFEAKVAAELAGLPEVITEKILEVSGNSDSDPRTG